VTSGRTYDNESNLAQEFLTELRSQYEGTRIGRQEIDAEVLEDVEGALWDWGMIHRLYPSESPQYRRIVVGVDPSISASGSGDACGIVAAGITPTHQIHVLQDRTLNGSPLAWSRQAVKLAIELEADAMVYEVNQGGAMVSETLKLALKSLDHHIRLIPIHAARGKTLRAEPVVSLYEQGKVEHIGNLAALEEEMTGWVPDISTRSPNRVDALVYALTELAIKVRKPFIVSVA
jgi:phage terminase large subunit-like protein